MIAGIVGALSAGLKDTRQKYKNLFGYCKIMSSHEFMNKNFMRVVEKQARSYIANHCNACMYSGVPRELEGSRAKY